MTGALAGLQAAQGAITDQAGVALRYGDLADEVAAVESSAGLFDPGPCGVIIIRGPQAGPFLNGLVTTDVEALALGKLQHTLICANKGKILHHCRLVRSKAEEYLLITEPGELEAVGAYLDFYHIREELQMGQSGLVRLDLLGPAVPGVLRSHDIAEVSVDGRFAEGALVTLSDPLGHLPRTLVLIPESNAPAFVDALIFGEPAVRLMGLESCEELRIRAGLPRFGTDYGQDHLPAEAAVLSHVSFTKGCYVGQEIHARMHHRGHPNRKLVVVEWPETHTPALNPGSALFHDGTEVGRITSQNQVPVDGKRRAIAMVRYTAVKQGALLAAAIDEAPAISMTPLRTDLGGARG